MKNPILPQVEVDKLNEVIQKIGELEEIHSKVRPNVLVGNDLMKLHTVVFLDTLKDFFSSVTMLKGLLEISEKEFQDAITDGGKITVEDAKKMVMLKMITELVSK